MLHQQFVGENTQTINRGGFHAQNNRAKCNRLASMTAGERKFRRCEIAFRADKHQDALGTILVFARIIREDFFQVLRIGLERSDEAKIESGNIFLQP